MNNKFTIQKTTDDLQWHASITLIFSFFKLVLVQKKDNHGNNDENASMTLILFDNTQFIDNNALYLRSATADDASYLALLINTINSSEEDVKPNVMIKPN